MKPSRTSRVVPGFERPDVRPWSVAVFRQVRRADLRTGYAGSKPSPFARLRAAFLDWCRRGTVTNPND